MWRGILLTLPFVILLTWPLEVSSQQPCGKVQCGYSATCEYGRLNNPVECNCNFSTETTPWQIIKKGGLRYCRKICGNGQLCPDNTTCVNYGTDMKRCECSSGYYLSSIGQCLSRCDLIECGQGTVCNLTPAGNPICQNPCELNPCDKNATCQYNGYVMCTCKPGFTKNSTFSCVAICEMAPCGPNMTCNVTAVGDRICQCRPRYRETSSGHCIPQCEITPCGPNMTCNVNAEGGPNCQCRLGYRRNSSGHCIHVCENNRCGENAICTYNATFIGNHLCSCKPGFNYTVVNSVGICLAQCEITPCGLNMICNVSAVGGPNCQCRPGYRKTSSEHCIPRLITENSGGNKFAVFLMASTSSKRQVTSTERSTTNGVAKSTLQHARSQATSTERSTTNGVTKSAVEPARDQGDGKINTVIIVAAVIPAVVAMVVFCAIIYVFCRYQRHKEPTNIPVVSTGGSSRIDSVTGRNSRSSFSSLGGVSQGGRNSAPGLSTMATHSEDIRRHSSWTGCNVATALRNNPLDITIKSQGYGSIHSRTIVQERSSEYDLEALYGNAKIPENKRLALENKNAHLDNLYSNSSIAENKRRAHEDNTAGNVAELSLLDKYAIFQDGAEPCYNTLAETGFANGVTGSQNSPLSASCGCIDEEENDCDYNHLRFKVL